MTSEANKEKQIKARVTLVRVNLNGKDKKLEGAVIPRGTVWINLLHVC